MHKNFLTFIVSAMLLFVPSWSQAAIDLPPTAKVELGPVEDVCSDFTPAEWRKEQVIDGVKIQESRLCNPDNPADIAAFVKGTNNISMTTLMETQLAADAITMSDDIDGDGDPDKIVIKLEVVELNGHSPDMKERLRGMGSEPPAIRTPEQFTSFVSSELKIYSALVKRSGAKAD